MVKEKIRELSHFNALCSLLVVLIHVVSFALSRLEPTSWQMAAMYFPSRLSAFVVPGFLFVGAVKMGAQIGDPMTAGQYGAYLLSRVKKIYVPYLIWNTIYYFAFLSIGYVRGEAAEFFRYALDGTLSSPFYYVLIVMQFYALRPLWRWVVKTVPFPAAACWGLLISLVSVNAGNITAQFGVDFPYADRIFPSYLIFWLAGLYAGAHYEAFSQGLRRAGKAHWVSAGFVLAFCVIAYLNFTRGIWILDLTGPKMVVDLLSTCLMLRLAMALEESREGFKKVLGFLYRASFFTYLSHCLFLTLAAHYAQVGGIHDVGSLLLIRAAASYGIPLGLYWLWERIRKTAGKG